MSTQIENTSYADLPGIFRLYDDAIAYQKKVGNNNWQGFEVGLVRKEIDEGRHFKILAEEELVGTFCITFSDPAIWHTQPEVPAIYIHRIATSEASRGRQLVKSIVDWAKGYAERSKLRAIRMDTGSGNSRLINYYQHCGFRVLGDTAIKYTPDMPAHYRGGLFTLLEMEVD